MHIDAEDMRDAVACRAGIILGCLFGFLCATWVFVSLAVPASGGVMPLLFVLGLSGAFWFAVAAWIAVPAVAAAVIIRLLWVRRYRAAAGWSLVPAVGVLLVLYGIDLGDMIHFWLNKARYDRIVSDVILGRCSHEDSRGWKATIVATECQAPAIIAFEHDRMLSVWRGIVYDASDEIAKPPHERSAAWKSRDVAELIGCSEVRVAFGGHYYAVSGEFGLCG